MVVLYLGDCLEKMKSVADKSVDLIICDLPFGCLIGGGGKEKINRKAQKLIDFRNTSGKVTKKLNVYGGVISGCSWDIKIELVEFWKQVKRIRKNDHTPTLMFCTTKYGFDLYNSNPKEFRYDLVWDKQRGVSFLTANKMPMRSHEMIYVFSKAGANYNRIDMSGNVTPRKETSVLHTSRTIKASSGLRIQKENDGTKKCPLSVIQFNKLQNSGKLHPTEKPVELYKYLIERYSNSDDTVLDPTFGSGNSGLACNELNRKYIGIEKDNNFFWMFAKKVI